MSELPAAFWSLELVGNATSEVDRLATIVENVQFCMFCVTMTTYSVIIWALLEAQKQRVKELTSPFFKLCLATAFFDVWTLLVNYFGAMFPKWGWFVPVYLFLGTSYARVYLFFAWSTGISQAMGVSVLASNRLSVMIFPAAIDRMWHGYRLWIAIGIYYFTGPIISCSTFINTVALFRNGKNGIVPRFLNKSITNVYFTIGGVFLFTNSAYIVCTYLYLFWVLHKRQNQINPTPSSISKMKAKARVREMRLFMMSTCIVAVQLAVLTFFILRSTGILTFTSDQFYLIYNVISDLYASINPYLLWIFSDSLRKYIFERLGIRKKVKKLTSITQSVLLV